MISLLQDFVYFASQRLVRFSQRSGIELAGSTDTRNLAGGKRPYAAQAAVRTFDAGARPFECLFRWRGKHGEQAGGVGAILLDLRLRVDAVVLGLGHLLGTADFDRLAIGPE